MRKALLLATALLSGSSLLLSSCQKAPAHLNLLLVTLDTVRADRMGCYGYRFDTTPNIDRLAKEGVVFTRAFTPVPVTLPSHATLLTGTHPLCHGIHNNGSFVLEDAVQTLAEDLKERGFQTGAVIGAVVLESQFGLNQGFDDYDDDIPEGSDSKLNFSERKADEVSRLGIQWIEKCSQGPFFLWLHYFDPHKEYDPPFPFRKKFGPPYYDGEIACVDFYFNRVLEKLKELRILENTLIILAGDHGEGLGEHNEAVHGIFLYDATVRVPLIFHCPYLLGKNLTIDAMVDLMDIRPTVLDLLNIPAKGEMQGRSLVPLLKGKEGGRSSILLETDLPALNYGWSPLGGIRTEEWKYILAPRPELYRVSRDQGEKEDLSSKEPKQMKAMEEKYWALRKEMEGGEGGLLAKKKELSEEMAKKLSRLGYVWSKEERKGQEGKDPKDMIKIENAYHAGRFNLVAGDRQKGLKILEKILEEDPENFSTLLALGEYFFENGDLKKAEEYLERAEKVNPYYTEIHMKLGLIFMGRSEFPKALKKFEDVQALRPQSPIPANNIACIYGLQDLPEKAEEWYRKALALNPSYTNARINLAKQYIGQNRIKEAEQELVITLERDPGSLEALLILGSLYHVQKKTNRAIELGERALRLSPSSPAVYQYLKEWYAAAGLREKADAAARKKRKLEAGKRFR